MDDPGGWPGTRSVDPDGVTHINLGGIRYVALAPADSLRRAVREYLNVRPCFRDGTLAYLTTRPPLVLCRGDWEKVLSAASGAADDDRLSREARLTFARIRAVLTGAVPFRPQETRISNC